MLESKYKIVINNFLVKTLTKVYLIKTYIYWERIILKKDILE